MLRAIGIGIIAAIVFELPLLLRSYFASIPWFSPYLILAGGVLVFLIYHVFLNKKQRLLDYRGLSDLLIHIHSPTAPEQPRHWLVRSACSLLFTLIGGPVGGEGAAIEASQGFAALQRPRSSRWFEQMRRTDSASALTAGLSASFGAPFAAVLVPIELGLGGRTLSVAISGLSAFVSVRILDRTFLLERFHFGLELFSFDIYRLQQWMWLLSLAILCGVLSAGIIHLIRYFQINFSHLFKFNILFRILLGVSALFLLACIHAPSHLPPGILLENILLSKSFLPETALCFITLLASLALFLSCFGT
ncbi:MAG: chloride channel protein, partial [Bdellovibrio sp.]|nr:chloride channel protein [Bdellovibrio sp.]